MNYFKIIAVDFIVLNVEEFLDDLVGFELDELESSGPSIEKVVFIVDFDFVNEEFSGFVGQVGVAVMFVNLEGSPGEDLKQELKNDDKLPFHGSFVCIDNRFLLFLTDALGIDF